MRRRWLRPLSFSSTPKPSRPGPDLGGIWSVFTNPLSPRNPEIPTRQTFFSFFRWDHAGAQWRFSWEEGGSWGGSGMVCLLPPITPVIETLALDNHLPTHTTQGKKREAREVSSCRIAPSFLLSLVIISQLLRSTRCWWVANSPSVTLGTSGTIRLRLVLEDHHGRWGPSPLCNLQIDP